MKTLNLFLLSGGFLILLNSCASTSPPLQQLTETETIIMQAQQIGAADYAPLDIREARMKLDRAREKMNQGENEEAAMLAEQARVDAELAQMKTLSGKSQLALNELRESIRILREEVLERIKSDIERREEGEITGN